MSQEKTASRQKLTEQVIKDSLRAQNHGTEEDRWLAYCHKSPETAVNNRSQRHSDQTLLTLDASVHFPPLQDKCGSFHQYLREYNVACHIQLTIHCHGADTKPSGYLKQAFR